MRQKNGRQICVQLLQTLNILFENISNETSVCKCFKQICICITDVLSIAKLMQSAVTAYQIFLNVRLSVTCIYWVKINEHRIKWFSWSGNAGWYRCCWLPHRIPRCVSLAPMGGTLSQQYVVQMSYLTLSMIMIWNVWACMRKMQSRQPILSFVHCIFRVCVLHCVFLCACVASVSLLTAWKPTFKSDFCILMAAAALFRRLVHVGLHQLR